MLLVYTSHIGTRFKYILQTLFGKETEITESKEKFLQYEGPKINYSVERITANECWIQPYGLLSETGISQQPISIFEYAGLKCFFAGEGDISFDIFSASFYLLSRYEEYLPHELDEYGRYAHTNSIAYKKNFLDIPLVNLWIMEIQKILPGWKPAPREFVFIPTYDIDIAYSYLHQPVWKNVLGFFRDLLKSDLDKVVERGNVYSGRKKDPFDTFDWIDQLHQHYQLHPIYFFLTIIKRGEYDKNLLARSKALQNLYKRLSLQYSAGLHPSWQSGTEECLLQKEINLLQRIIQKPIHLSRNHYLRFTLPHTYRRLIQAGITDDYSMAYSSINGFRASYALPYYWYDIEKEELTALQIHPFCYMEANSFFEQKYSAAEAAIEIQHYHDAVKKVNGEFITLFHNHFLTEQEQWMPWRKMYRDFLEKNFHPK